MSVFASTAPAALGIATITPRPFQLELVDSGRDVMRLVDALLMVVPTGGGKTVIGSWIIRLAIQRGRVVLFLVHREELLRQTIAKLGACGIADVRVISAGSDEGSADARVIVASIPTLIGKTWRDRLPHADFLIFDEAHHVAAKSWTALANSYANAKKLGLTATPQRGDGVGLGDIFKAIIVGPSVSELTEMGYLVPCHALAPGVDLASGKIAMSPTEAYLKFADGRRAIVFCQSVIHAAEVAQAMNDIGIAAAAVDGTMPKKLRADTLARFAAGEIRVITNCAVLTEGFDDPGVAVCILARKPGHSGLYLQMVGRVLRPAPGKTEAILVDLCGAVRRYGLPNAERTYSLDGAGILIAKRPSLKQCPRCAAVFLPKPTCSHCGFVFPVADNAIPDVVDSDITKVDAVAPMTEWKRIHVNYPGRCCVCDKPFFVGWSMFWAAGVKPNRLAHTDCYYARSREDESEAA